MRAPSAEKFRQKHAEADIPGELKALQISYMKMMRLTKSHCQMAGVVAVSGKWQRARTWSTLSRTAAWSRPCLVLLKPLLYPIWARGTSGQYEVAATECCWWKPNHLTPRMMARHLPPHRVCCLSCVIANVLVNLPTDCCVELTRLLPTRKAGPRAVLKTTMFFIVEYKAFLLAYWKAGKKVELDQLFTEQGDICLLNETHL